MKKRKQFLEKSDQTQTKTKAFLIKKLTLVFISARNPAGLS